MSADSRPAEIGQGALLIPDVDSAPEPTDPPPTDAELAGTDDVDPDPPVYDERGNVRPRGTKGAKPMTLAQRKAIARKIANQ